MTTSDKTVLVLGATGRQGGATARHLLDKGWKVRILVRDPDKVVAQDFKDRGAEVLKGDFDDAESLNAAMQQVYGVFSVQAFTGVEREGEVRQGKAIADAAKAAGVQHFVFTSVQSAEDLGRVGDGNKWEIEQYIWSLGLPATIIRPCLFMNDLLDARYGIPQDTFNIGFNPDVKIGLIASDDIGAFAALAFEHPDQYLGKTLEIAGDALTPIEVAATISQALGRTINYVHVPVETLRQIDPKMAGAFDFLNAVGYTTDIETLRKLHPNLINLKQYLQTAGQALVAANR